MGDDGDGGGCGKIGRIWSWSGRRGGGGSVCESGVRVVEAVLVVVTVIAMVVFIVIQGLKSIFSIESGRNYLASIAILEKSIYERCFIIHPIPFQFLTTNSVGLMISMFTKAEVRRGNSDFSN